MNYFLLLYAIVQMLIAYVSIALVIDFITKLSYFLIKKSPYVNSDALLFKVITLSVLIGIDNYMTCTNF